MRIEAAGLTDTGSVRENNEDAYLLDVHRGLFLVADGMGGLDAGEVASRMAVDAVASALPDTARPDCEQSLTDKVVRAVREANRAVHAFARQGSASARAGTTLVCLAACRQGFVLANVGDSRAYRVRDGGISQLSQDHSVVMAKVRQGLITAEEAARSPERNVIYRALGMEADLEVDAELLTARPGDAYLLCSDGLSDVLSDEDLLGAVVRGEGQGLDALCAGLVALALERRARDNVTVILVRCLA